MGRNKKKGKRSNARWTNRSSELDMSNARFEKYYKEQQILPDDEWDAFMRALRQPLPSTFRIASNRQMKDVLSDAIKNSFIPALEAGTYNGEPLPVPRPIPWFPEGLAWHISLARKELKKSPEYKKFHEFLVYETEVGNISRQEAVSMIPPLFLDVRPHHCAIDLCAAPGSKTAQLIEAMDPPTGILIANDADHKRAHLLVHQSSRLPSPGLLVTNLDASVFPALKYKDRPLRFDRILADVPCSGDGTLRKNVGIWNNWSPMEGNGLHALQIRILQRAMRMLKFDSESEDKPRIVYSTCSLNAVENEAVIAAALNSIPGYELVDVSETLPDLLRRPGVSSWRPAVDRDVDLSFASYNEYYDSFEASSAAAAATPLKEEESTDEIVTGDGQGERVDPRGKGKGKARTKGKVVRNRMLATQWPPENVADLKLDRCMRIYPHLQDSGGFFVAVLERKTAVAARDEPLVKTEGKRPAAATADITKEKPSMLEASGEPVAKKARLADDVGKDISREATPGAIAGEPATETGGAFKEDPYTFISSTDPTLVSCIDKLSLSESFPRENLFVRNPEGAPVRSLYLVNDAVKSVMVQTDYTRIRLVSAGVKLFGRSEIGNMKGLTARPETDMEGDAPAKIQFRVLSEGLLALIPYVDQDKLLVGGAKQLRILLQAYYPLCASFEEPFRTGIEKSSLGSHIIRFSPGDYGNTTLSHDLFLPLWKSDVSVSLMIDKKAKSALSLRFFGEDITVAGVQAAKQQAAKASKPEEQDEAMVEDEDAVEEVDDADE